MLQSHRQLVALVSLLLLREATADDECAVVANRDTCQAAGQLCSDPDPNIANDWTCRCESWLGYTDATTVTALAAAATTCTRVTACSVANTAVCTAANQACVATPGGTAADFECRCIPPLYCDNGIKLAATGIAFDECSAICTDCADIGDGNGNACNAAGLVCLDATKTTAAVPAGNVCGCLSDITSTTCTYAGECAANSGTCTAQGQHCEDPTGMATMGDWRCVCVGPATGDPVTAGAATCVIDECTASCPTCASTGGANLCALNGQVCVDPSAALGDWQCGCPIGATKTAGGNQAPAVCTYAGGCATGNNYMTCGKNQYCYDPTPSQTNTWGCMCLGPYTGAFVVGGAATCALDECKATCPTCAGMMCEKYGQRCTDGVGLGDWQCECDGTVTMAQQVGGLATCTGTGVCAGNTQCGMEMKSCTDNAGVATCGCVPPTTGTTTCVLDECTVYGSSCIAPYKCLDPNTALTSIGDWVCSVDECNAVCLTCPRTTEGGAHVCFDAGQTCNDPSATVTGDWSCTCAGDSTGAAVVGGVATCTTPMASECTANGGLCTSASQACTDPDTNTADDWTCNCLNAASVKTGGIASVATCTLNECTATCSTCAGATCPVGQTCVDPNTAETSTSDWYCQCDTGSGIGAGRAATCITDECIAGQGTCLAANQECFDPDTSVANDVLCRCPHDVTQTSPIGTITACTYTDECNVPTPCPANQFCQDPNAANPNDWTCNCIAPFTGAAVQGAAATCVQDLCGKCANCADQGSGNMCTMFGQTCATDTMANKWKCVCPVGQTGELIEGVAVCEIDECTANAATCSAGQTCMDVDKDPASTGDWYCECPSNGPRAKAQAAVCTVDECVGNVICGMDQACSDPDTGVSNDWICTCNSDMTVTAVAMAATCPIDECVGNTVCPAGQTCNDVNLLAANNWQCVCDTDMTVTATGMAATCPMLDECVGITTCPAGQTCDDPESLLVNDWLCVCDNDNNLNATGMAAVCTVDECVGNTVCSSGQTCTDPDTSTSGDWRCNCVGGGFVVGGPCVDECATNTVCGTASQICVDSDQTKTDTWGCRCNTAADTITFANLSVAICGTAVNECAATPCGASQTCNDPVQLSNSLNDFVCTCTSGATKTGGPANCNDIDECAASPCGTGQTCNDPSISVSGDYVCSCTGTAVQGTGKPASPCGSYENECFNCPGVACPCGNTGTQTCNDPAPTTTTKNDFVCTCTLNSVSLVGLPVANCVADTPVPGPSTANRYFFNFKSNIAAAQFSEALTVAAIVKVVNFIEGTSNLDTGVVGCSGCSQVTSLNVRKHCFAATCASVADYAAATAGRDGVVLQGNAEGVFEFVGTTVTTETAKQVWLANLEQSQQALIADPNIQLVGGTFVTNTLTPEPLPSDDDDDGIPWWVWLLIVLAILLCCLLIFLIWWFKFRDDKEKKKQEEEEAQRTYESEMKEHHRNDEDPMRNGNANGHNGEGANGHHSNGDGHGHGSGASNGSDVAAKKGAEDDKLMDQYSGGGGGGGGNPINTVFPQRQATVIPVGDDGSRSRAGSGAGAGAAGKETVILGFGRNMEGQLGLGEAEDLQVQFVPMEIQDFRGLGVNMMACGSFHTYVVLLDATVMVFGDGSDGQLGLGNRLAPKIPTPVPFFKGKVPRIIACGEQHSVVVCNDNLYVCGSGQDGQLGLGDIEDRLLPTAVPLFSGRGIDVDMVSCGSHHTCVVYDGILYTMGWNRFGQLGLGDDINRNEPTEAVFFRGKVIRDIQCGVQHTVVLCTDGVYVMGGNTFGQLGLGHQMNQHEPQRVGFFDGKAIKSISAWFHTLVSCDDGVYAFGEAMHSKLGTDPYEWHEDAPNVVSPRVVPFFSSKDVISVSAGSEHSVLHCSDGVYIWGNSEGGKLGHGHMEPVHDPASSRLEHLQSYIPHLTAIGVDHTLIYASPR